MNDNDISYISLPFDKDIVYSAIKQYHTSYKYIDLSFFNNKEFILSHLVDSEYSNGYDEEKFKDDKDIVIASLKKCCKNIIHCSYD